MTDLLVFSGSTGGGSADPFATVATVAADATATNSDDGTNAGMVNPNATVFKKRDSSLALNVNRGSNVALGTYQSH